MRRAILPVTAALVLLLAAAPAVAARKKQGPGKPTPDRAAESCKDITGDQLEACKVVGKFLDLWKAQKWAEAKKLIHPKTLESIAEVKKNTKEERHGMAGWYWAKTDFLPVDWKLSKLEDSESGTVQFHTQEKHYRVEEDGFSEGGEGEEASYLAGRKDGTWYVVDVLRGGGGFDKTSIRVGRKGYFDAPKTDGAAEPAPTEK